MSDIAAGTHRQTQANLSLAVHRHRLLSRKGLLERAFTCAFSGLVYPQIWEDPVVDMEALSIRDTDHIVAIASGGCNVMSYLTASPSRITALDINDSHIALNKLKIAAVAHLPTQRWFRDFFLTPNDRRNVKAYDNWIAPRLDPVTRSYWERRDALGRRRIGIFARGLYRHGLLGRFIGAGHLLARLHGVNPRIMLNAKTLEEQRAVFDREIAPIFDSWLVRALVKSPASLYGLGIPPTQYHALAADGEDGILAALRARMERLACGFPLCENYFAWQAFARGYDPSPEAALPPYLEEKNFEAVRARCDRIDVRHESITGFLADSPAASADCYVLLDAQDWMGPKDLTALWTEIERTARPGARVIFRTAADERLLPDRVPEHILSRWRYDSERCRLFTQRDRSAIYGGFHLYRREP